MSTVRWGILSTSHHAEANVIPAIKESASGEVVAVASRDAGRAQQFAASRGIPGSYGSYEALLNDPKVDVVYNPLPNHLHKEWTIRALQAGKHVLCEKPIGLNAAEAEDMVRAARASGRKLAETFQWRHHPQGQRMRQMIQEGVIGDLRLIEAGFSFMLDRPNDIRSKPELGGGALYDVGCYPIALTRYMTGTEPVAVTAQAHWGPSGIDDLVVATLEFPGGVLAHINCSFVLPLRRYYTVVGAKGSLSVYHAYNPKRDTRSEIVHHGEDHRLIETIPLKTANSYTLMIEDYNQAVIENRDPVFPPEDAVSNMRVIDAIFAAAKQGRTVKV